ncbi:MAG: hypothetical protein HY698_10005 [Deltaproteobacteria bacterium]|nr:hypothetical protein [Deltaproteobacteria bacterium]
MLELEPLLARRLIREATFNLTVACAAAFVITASAVVFFRLSQRAERMEEQAARQRHLAALGQMSATLAHEIRNPLAAAKGHAQLLAEQVPEGHPGARSAVTVVDSLVRLEALVTRLLEFARSGEIRREDVSPAELLRAAAEEAAKGRVKLDVSGAPPAFPLDELHVHRTLVNLLQNALQASPDGAPIEASASLVDEGLVFTVRDHGAGLPQGAGAHLFQPFHTTRTHGAGLGLAIAQRVVTLHGGAIDAVNHPEGGALFRITLPRGRHGTDSGC